MTKEFFNNNVEAGSQSKKPIFIVGMPCSDTTLIEQLLSSLYSVFGAGEVEYIPDVLNMIDMGTFASDFRQRKFYFPKANAILMQTRESNKGGGLIP